jgi:hypothetical protein
MTSLPELGLIEGYYGGPWSWQERADLVSFLAPHGFRFHLYAPKSDPYLRRLWRELHPDTTAEAIKAFAAHCAGQGVRFGMGLSPLNIFQDFGGEAKAALAAKLAHLDGMGVQELGVFFDDMRGDLPELAATQLKVVDFIAERTKAPRITVCPTYYTDDAVLDRVFGQRPAGYLEDLGKGLDPAIAVFWTGEEVCSREYSPGHLTRVAEALRRPPTLWDNYPVNDGPRMSPYLHLRAFTGRPAAIGPLIAGHAINPALQPTLSLIPAVTLADSYRLGADYQYGQAFARAAVLALGEDLGAAVVRRVGLFNDSGLDNLEPDTKTRLREIFSAFDHPGAREIVGWLDGAYRFSKEMLDAEAFG